jgi:hypothetical protein
VALGCLSGERAAAQEIYDPYEDPGVTGPFHFHFGGQVAWPLAESADRVDVGWGFAAGVTYAFRPNFGIEFEYGLDWSDLETGKLANAGVVGDALFQYFNVNLLARPARAGRVSLYFVGGGGLYYREAQVTQITGTTVAPYCDPWLYYCSAVPVATGQVIGDRSSWDWARRAGVGSPSASERRSAITSGQYHHLRPELRRPGGGRSPPTASTSRSRRGLRF